MSPSLHDDRAAARTAALNERFLSRLSADLHDGPGQDLALALLRIDELAGFFESCRAALRTKGGPTDEFRIIRSALASALADLRATLAGLRLPEVEHLSPGQTAERAVHDFEQKTGASVGFTRGLLPDQASLSVKITLYRLLQEALSNGYRHADGAGQHVHLDARDRMLLIEVSDRGKGFDPRTVETPGLGLAEQGPARRPRRQGDTQTPEPPRSGGAGAFELGLEPRPSPSDLEGITRLSRCRAISRPRD